VEAVAVVVVVAVVTVVADPVVVKISEASGVIPMTRPRDRLNRELSVLMVCG
jgi:hypothetical protein